MAAAVRQLEKQRQGAADAILRSLLQHAPGHAAAADLLETIHVGIADRLAHDAAGSSPRYRAAVPCSGARAGAIRLPPFFQPVSEAALHDPRAAGLTVYPEKWVGRR